MRKARNEDGSLLFQSDEYLTSLQIASFFSRLAAKKSVLVSSSTSDLANEDYCDDLLSAMAEKELEEMSQEVINELSIQHPITFQSYNICEMSVTSKLSKFSIAVSEEICKHFELDTSTIKLKRKKPYINLFDTYVKSCTCSKNSENFIDRLDNLIAIIPSLFNL